MNLINLIVNKTAAWNTFSDNICKIKQKSMFLFIWTHQSPHCPWEESTPVHFCIHLYPSPPTSNKQIEKRKAVPFSCERFQMGMNISSRHPCVIPTVLSVEGGLFIFVLLSGMGWCLERDHSASTRERWCSVATDMVSRNLIRGAGSLQALLIWAWVLKSIMAL